MYRQRSSKCKAFCIKIKPYTPVFTKTKKKERTTNTLRNDRVCVLYFCKTSPGVFVSLSI